MVPDCPAILVSLLLLHFIFAVFSLLLLLLWHFHLHAVIRLFYLLYFMEVKQSERGAASNQELVSLMVKVRTGLVITNYRLFSAFLLLLVPEFCGVVLSRIAADVMSV
jgi:hypothetical protein